MNINWNRITAVSILATLPLALFCSMVYAGGLMCALQVAGVLLATVVIAFLVAMVMGYVAELLVKLAPWCLGLIPLGLVVALGIITYVGGYLWMFLLSAGMALLLTGVFILVSYLFKKAAKQDKANKDLQSGNDVV